MKAPKTFISDCQLKHVKEEQSVLKYKQFKNIHFIIG